MYPSFRHFFSPETPAYCLLNARIDPVVLHTLEIAFKESLYQANYCSAAANLHNEIVYAHEVQ